MKYIIIFVFSLSLLGGESSHTSMEGLIAQVLERHPKLKSSKMQISASKSGVDAAKWNYFPTPSIDFGAGKNKSTLARLEQPLWSGGRIDATYDISVSRQRESEIVLGENAYSLVETLLKTTYILTQARGRIGALKDGEAQLEVLKSQLDRRIEAGVSSLADRELIRSRLAQIMTDLSVAQTAELSACAQLRLLTSDADLSCAIDAPEVIEKESTLSVESMIAKTLKTHPTILKSDVQIQTAIHEKEKENSALWPTLSARAEYQKGSVYNDNSNHESLVYLSLQMNPGAGLSSLSAIEASEAKIQQLRFDKLTLEQELSDSVLRDYEEYLSAISRMEGTLLAIDSSQKVLESYSRLFLAGKRQWLDLVNSSREVTQNKMNLADLLSSAYVSRYRLKLKTGELISPLGTTDAQR